MKLIPRRYWMLLLIFVTAFVPVQLTFEEKQKEFPRVADAYERKEELFLMKCRSKEIPETFSDMFIRVFKREETLEIWAKNVRGKYVKFGEYKIYSMSGHLGPKRQQADAQVPEGFYYITEFNPQSSYHLSLGINYPNESDKILSNADRMGGDIFIHGGNVSAGCIAMSNYYIEDIYIAAVKARNQGQEKIPVEIFPFEMTRFNMVYYANFFQLHQYMDLWNNLAQGYRYFETNKDLPEVDVDPLGQYIFTPTSTKTK